MPVKKSLVVSRRSSEKKMVTSSLRGTKSRGNLLKTETDSSSPSFGSEPAAQNDKTKKARGLSVPVYSLVGKVAGSLELPKELFGAKINQALLAQAVRVYQTNQKAHWSNTKTRGEVVGSTRKVWSQKGTGRARHGAITAPIWVGGGIALGPKYRKTILDLPKKMKRAALVSALSQKSKDQEILGVNGLEKISGKTKEMARLMTRIPTSSRLRGASKSQESGKDKIAKGENKKLSALILTGDKNDLVVRAVRNIKGIDVLPADLVSILDVIKHQSLILTKEAVEVLEKRLLKKGKK